MEERLPGTFGGYRRRKDKGMPNQTVYPLDTRCRDCFKTITIKGVKRCDCFVNPSEEWDRAGECRAFDENPENKAEWKKQLPECRKYPRRRNA
jgi:hypothetical protein